MRELEYRLKKYDLVYNIIFLVVDYIYVYSDNYFKFSLVGILLMVNEIFDYEFNEVELIGSFRLFVYYFIS